MIALWIVLAVAGYLTVGVAVGVFATVRWPDDVDESVGAALGLAWPLPVVLGIVGGAYYWLAWLIHVIAVRVEDRRPGKFGPTL